MELDDNTAGDGRSERMQDLYWVHADPLLRFLLRLTLGNRPAAEDLVQETMFRAWRNLDSLPADPELARPWLYTVARRLAIDQARARRTRPAQTALDDTTLPAGGDATDQVLAAQLVHDGLQLLSADHRAVLTELYLLGSSIREAAERLGIPQGTVKSRSYHALRALSAAVDRPEPPDPQQ